ncbi:MAG TPA: TIM barrel protein, partial [Urbifossiella sp.]|nr:TIM barrel protein [Urbifossiella sp.]
MFDKSKVFLGITPTGWTNDDMPLLGNDSCNFEQIVSEMALAGFQGCSVGHKYPTDPVVLKRALDLRGLRVSEPWASLFFAAKDMRQQTLDGFRTQMAFIKALGGTDIVVAELTQAVHQGSVSPIPNKPVFDDAQWKALTAGLNEVGRMAADQGMRLAYHPHVGTGVMTLPEIDRLMAETDPKLVTLLYDTGHLYYAGVDPLVVVQKYA